MRPARRSDAAVPWPSGTLARLFAKLPGPKVVLRPLEGQRFQRAGVGDALGRGEHLVQDRDVGGVVVKVSHGEAERVLDEERS